MGQIVNFIVPRSRVAQTHQTMREEILAAIEPFIFESLSKGESVRKNFERDFAQKVGQPFGCATHSGTIGLYLALRGCGVGTGDEVITVGNSDISTTAAISHCGATPVLCDVQESDYTIDPHLVEPLISERTKAILPVDLYGHPADVKQLREIANHYSLKIVEDAALATGSLDHYRPVGTFADVTVFSFAPLKPLGCAGNGAIITSHDEIIARRISILCGYGHAPENFQSRSGHQAHVEEGFNVPLDPLQAALLAVKLPFLEQWTEQRRTVVATYQHMLQDLAVQLPTFRPESNPNFRSYTIRVKNQQAIYQGLKKAGIEVVLHYTPPVYRQPVYPRGLPGSKYLPVTDRLAKELICLPVSAELTEKDVTYVAEVLRDLLTSEPDEN